MKRFVSLKPSKTSYAVNQYMDDLNVSQEDILRNERSTEMETAIKQQHVKVT